MVKFLDLAAQFTSIETEVREAIDRVISESAFVSGKYAHTFEEEFRAYHGAKHCVGVGNGTDALELAIEALELPPGSKILVPANSFIASSEAVTRVGHRVRFVDCDPGNYTVSTHALEASLCEGVAAIMPVHIYGHPCDMDAVLGFARTHELRVIEDCAQAHGAEFRGRRVGTLGDIAAFSFYPGKNLGAYGDAGGVVTNDDGLARRVRMLANHGREDKHIHEFEGRNSRLDGLQAAVLSVKLRHLDSWIDARRSVAAQYDRGLVDLPWIQCPPEESWARHAYHLYVVRTDVRDALQSHLAKAGIQTGIHYPTALPDHLAYDYLAQQALAPVACRYASSLLSLPIGEHLSMPDIDKVIQAVRGFQGHVPSGKDDKAWLARSE